jgi:hypothetical protein
VISVADLKAALRIDTLEDAYAEEAQVALLEEMQRRLPKRTRTGGRCACFPNGPTERG